MALDSNPGNGCEVHGRRRCSQLLPPKPLRLLVVKNLLTCGAERRMMLSFISLSAAPQKKANVLSESLFLWDFFFLFLALIEFFPVTNGSD